MQHFYISYAREEGHLNFVLGEMRGEIINKEILLQYQNGLKAF